MAQSSRKSIISSLDAIILMSKASSNIEIPLSLGGPAPRTLPSRYPAQDLLARLQLAGQGSLSQCKVEFVAADKNRGTENTVGASGQYHS